MLTIGSIITSDPHAKVEKVITVAQMKPSRQVVWICNCGLNKPYYKCCHANRFFNYMRQAGELYWDSGLGGWKLRSFT